MFLPLVVRNWPPRVQLWVWVSTMGLPLMVKNWAWPPQVQLWVCRLWSENGLGHHECKYGSAACGRKMGTTNATMGLGLGHYECNYGSGACGQKMATTSATMGLPLVVRNRAWPPRVQLWVCRLWSETGLGHHACNYGSAACGQKLGLATTSATMGLPLVVRKLAWPPRVQLWVWGLATTRATMGLGLNYGSGPQIQQIYKTVCRYKNIFFG